MNLPPLISLAWKLPAAKLNGSLTAEAACGRFVKSQIDLK